MTIITFEVFKSIILSNPDLPDEMPEWFTEIFIVKRG